MGAGVGRGRSACAEGSGVRIWLYEIRIFIHDGWKLVLNRKMDDDDDDIPQLSSHTLAALQEFYLEQQQREGMKTSQGFNQYSVGSIEEDWQLSQFWYSDETASCLANEAVVAAGKGGRIACVSAPSVYQKLKEQDGKDFSVCILEYDRRFSVYGEEFIFYDYNHPLNLPENLLPHSFDIVIADPPYLSEECLQKTAETIKYLTKGKILLCTGTQVHPTGIVT
ncbi:EEF1A lysine methyltransferase 1 isoform X2 [Chroicocephalus ridibundus]|uniref:EEF1A lysine methyltransferase 1 isoform X2 n=1 Tax=Chroicocephalus ridibundus TaxID=1192867 RepID=UPI002FDD6BC3